jgi:hypothetical protein
LELSEFDSFRAELRALIVIVQAIQKSTLRDENLRERFRTLFRTWTSTVEPLLATYHDSRREVLKLRAEIEKLAQLASKQKAVVAYKKYLHRACQLSDNIVIRLPPTSDQKKVPVGPRQELFTSGIPDLPFALVPNPIVGWRSRLENFLTKYPFDKSVFIMIRYRKRNDKLIKSIKNALSKEGLFGVLAREHNLTDDLYNAVACLLCCARGIAVFDRPEAQELFNPNVAYELGMLHLLGRRCLILKHNSLTTLQTDILMKLYTPYEEAPQITTIIKDWTRS